MRKDDHLIFEAFSQQRVIGDEQAAKLIADKIKGTPNLNIQNIKMYVSKYLGMVGKAPTDVDHISAYVLDILNSQGMAEDAEDMSKSPFHYDPMHGLAQAANQINDILKSSYNDEARPEHIEQMALKILGPQSEYASVDEFNKALVGVTALLNRYIVTEMN